MTVAQVIEQVKDTLKEPSSWGKNYAAACNGMPVDIEEGTCFCILGALWKNTSEVNEEGSDGFRAEELLHKLAKEKGFYGIPNFNDSPTTTHKDVIAFLDLAIERAKADANQS